MPDRFVQTRLEGRIAHITLDRVEHHNAIDSPMMQALGDALEGLRGNADFVVLRGAGADFSIGRDQHEKIPGQKRRESLGLAIRVNTLVAGFDGITIAAVRGRAYGFSTGMAMQCDYTIAADTATFGFDEIKHGFPPTIVMTYLSTFLSKKHTLDVLLSGRYVNAPEALGMGMLTRVVAGDELDRYVDGLLENLQSRKLTALKRIKSYLVEIERIEPASRPEYALNADAPAS
ncbi:MAG TPA: enoyl-CoA hydratase/isomerase family protein [Candidatus Lustribacter sp.]